MRDLLGLSGLQWVALIVAFLSIVVVAESWLGHFRSGFPFRAQFAPLGIGGLLAVAGVLATAAPHASWALVAFRSAGAAALIAGLVGMGYHLWFGVVRGRGGYPFLFHSLMYGAPPLAPLALSVLGALALATGQALAGQTSFLGIGIWRMLLAIASFGLAGAIAQAAILHYRGAFNTPMMYAPFVIPPLAVIAAAWMTAAPGHAAQLSARVSLWLTFLTGFIGLGMHLRGLDRQMGGLHVFLFNMLQGPPPLAPVVFAGLSAVALAAIELVR